MSLSIKSLTSVLAIYVFANQSAADAPNCRLSEIAQDCKIFEGKDRVEGIRFADGTRIPHPDLSPQRDLSLITPAQLKKRADRLVTLFDFAKEALLDKISGGQKLETLSSEQQALYNKVNAVQLAPYSVSSKDQSCTKNPRDAFFDARDSFVTVCPGYLNFPDASLVEILGHEIGHSIDYCYAQFPVVRVDADKVAKLGSNPSSFPDEIRSNPDRASLAIDLGKLARGTRPNILQDLKFLDDAEGTLSYFADKGVVRRLAEGVPSARNPYEDLYTCFQKETGTRAMSTRDLKAISKNYVDLLELKREVRGRQKFALRARVEAIASKYPECNDLKKNSQKSEMSADPWGAVALGRWVSVHPPKTDEEKLAPLASLIVYFCRDEKHPALAVPKVYFAKISDANSYAQETTLLPARVRADKIYLTEARIQSALGCLPVDKAKCFEKFMKPNLKPAQHTVEANASSTSK